MSFTKVCTLDDIWEGEMEAYDVDGHEILLVWPDGGDLKAFQGICPHQDMSLSDGSFDGKIVTCKAHLWQFDASSGEGVNPKDCALAIYPIKIEGDDVYVDAEATTPLFAHT